MATETTGLLSGCIVDIPRDRSEYEVFGISRKTKSLSFEELMPFQEDPWWQNIRRTFLLSFWITLILIFVSACILSILQHGSCDTVKGDTSTTGIFKAITTMSTLVNTGSVKMP